MLTDMIFPLYLKFFSHEYIISNINKQFIELQILQIFIANLAKLKTFVLGVEAGFIEIQAPELLSPTA